MNEVIVIDRARREIAALDSLPDFKDYFAKISALRVYTKAARKDRDEQNDIGEAMVRTSSAGGRLLRNIKRAEEPGDGKPGPGRGKNVPLTAEGFMASIKKAGFKWDMAHRWQVINHISEKRLEQFFADIRDSNTAMITMVAAYKLGKKHLPPPELSTTGDDYSLHLADISDGLPEIEDASVDVIITDPPYPQEFLPLLGELSEVAARVLRPGGSCLVMVGQSYLPEVMSLLGGHLNYQWTIAYLTPGGQSVQLWDRNVNTFWKPVLWFVNGEHDGPWTGDVIKSDVNDNDKRFHEWGQSESGTARLVEAFSQKTDIVLDPFLGGGATALATLTRGRRFIGADISQEAIDTTLRRLETIYGKEAA